MSKHIKLGIPCVVGGRTCDVDEVVEVGVADANFLKGYGYGQEVEKPEPEAEPKPEHIQTPSVDEEPETGLLPESDPPSRKKK